MAKPTSLRSRLGSPPVDDSLAVVGWTIRALGALLDELLDEPGVSRARRRAEMLKIADRIAKLRDLGRIHRAEQAVNDAASDMADTRGGPQLDAAADATESPGRLVTRRGKPPRRTLR
jgi:hypothetical protein